jgi:glycosyltransferase involved in cell wall biosynthesis
VRTSVVANGVDVDYFRGAGARAAPKDGRLVMVSGMNWFPNKDAAIYMARDIWPALAASMPSLSLTVVGASPPPEVTSLAAADSRVTATGFVDDVRPHMNEAQVYLCPMRDGGGTRLKILDALSMGVPIVATTMAYEGIDVVPEQDVLVADDPAAFVRQVKRLVDDPALREKLSANGRAFVERNFSWPVIGRKMQQSFSEIVRARAR